MNLGELETPALILDRRKLEANAGRMREHAEALGVLLRPHVKTLKSIEAAALYAEPAGRITVSTLLEAEVFAQAGYRDMLYSVGVAPNKLSRVAALRKRGVDLTVMIDTIEAAAILAEAGKREGVSLSAMIEVDVDGHRAGVAPDGDQLIPICKTLSAGGGARLRGVAAHAGSSYAASSLEAIAQLAEQERAQAVGAADRLRAAGFEVSDVSVGSTPTALLARSLEGVTELRAGVYTSFDLVMAGLGVCSLDDIAMSVLCTVIGHQPDKGWVLVDAGWMAMSCDLGTSSQKVDQRYGVVCDEVGCVLDELVLRTTNQEQGIVTRRGGGPIRPAEFPYGRRLRILPVHACATGAQHERYHVLDGGQSVEAVWSRVNAW